MVQLIKINNEGETGFFSSQFQDIITIPKEGQVALVSSTFSMGLSNIDMTAENNTLSFFRKGGAGGGAGEPVIDVTVPTGRYSQSSFIQQLRTSINSVQTILTQKENSADVPRGFDINPAVTDDGYFSLSFGKTDYIELDDTDTTMYGVTYASSVFTAGAGSGADFNYPHVVFSTDHFQNGSGQAHLELSGNGFVGLCVQQLNGTVVESDITYGILAKGGDSYYGVLNGTKTSLGVVPDFSKTQVITLESGKISFFEEATLLVEYNYDYNTAGYFLGAGVQNTGATITSIYMNPTSFLTTEGNYTYHNDTNTAEIFRLVGASAPMLFSITLNSNLTEMLGYTKSTLRVKALQKTFIAQVPFKDAVLAESVEVHLVNVGDIKSYDSNTKKIQQIIGIIPLGSATVGNNIPYSFPELLYIDLNNRYDIPVSSLQFRVLGADTGSEIQFEGGITMTLAIKKRAEI